MHYYDDDLTLYTLLHDVFCAAAVTCFLLALHRIANGLALSGRLRAYDKLSEAYAPEEREVLVHKIKRGSLHD